MRWEIASVINRCLNWRKEETKETTDITPIAIHKNTKFIVITAPPITYNNMKNSELQSNNIGRPI